MTRLPRSTRYAEPALFDAKPRDTLREWLEDCLAGIPDLYVRRMFGGAGIYSADVMFGILARGRVYLKTDESTRNDFIARGTQPFRTRKGIVLQNYYEVPVDVLEDERELLRWARRALDVARAGSASPRRARRGTSRAR